MPSYLRITQALASNPPLVAQPIVSSNSNTTGSEHGDGVKLGLGIGIPGGVIMAVLGALLWKRCRRPTHHALDDEMNFSLQTNVNFQHVLDQSEYEHRQLHRGF